MKFAADRPWSDPEKVARKLLKIANDVEVVQDGRIYIELINGPFLFREHATPAEYSAGLKLAIERGWLWMHDSGTHVKFARAGADLTTCARQPRRGPVSEALPVVCFTKVPIPVIQTAENS